MTRGARKPPPRALRALHAGRIAAAWLVLGGLAASAFLQSAAFIAVHDVLAWLQFLPSLWTLILAGLASLSFGFLIVAAVTLVFGRVYCAALCPLGIAQDGILWAARRLGRRPRGYSRPLNLLRYGVAGGTVVLLAAGIPAAVDLLEPYSFFGRILHNLGGPAVAYPLSRAASAALELLGVYVPPLSWSVHLGALATTAVLFGLLAALTVFRGRLYCNTLCPVGALLGLMARFSRLAVVIDGDKCTRCGRCVGVCPAQCIDAESGSVDLSRCVSCFRCLSACSFDAMRYGRPPGRVRVAGAAGLKMSRRDFLRSAAGLGVGAGLALAPALRAAGREAGAGTSVIVPPGAFSVSRFLSTCTACHLCVSRCPTHVLQPSLLSAGPRGIFQPRLDYQAGKCDFQCNLCSQVCPSGALLPLSLRAKQETRIGTAEFVLHACVVYTKGTPCGACAEICPTGAAHMVPYRNGLTIPALIPELCIGCGSCEFVCPAVPVRAITVKGIPEHQRVSLGGATRVEQKDPEESEQGFAF